METKFFRCSLCGNIVVKLVDSGVTPFCCGKEMEELAAHTAEGNYEKHLPAVHCAPLNNDVVNYKCLDVQVGSVEHPMTPEHFIEFIYLETNHGGQFAALDPTAKPVARFIIGPNCQPKAVYEYCNIHGLWKKELTSKEAQ